MRRMVRMLLAGVALAGSAVVVGAGPAQERPNFDGWIVIQNDQERRFPRAERWSASLGPDSLTLKKGGEYVTFYGSFRAVDLRRAKPLKSSARRTTTRGWTLSQGGASYSFLRAEGWDVSLNQNGAQVDGKGVSAWFYGTFQVEFSP